MNASLSTLKNRSGRALLLVAVSALALAVSLARYYFDHSVDVLFSMCLCPLGCVSAGLVLFASPLPKTRPFRVLLAFFAVFVLSLAANEVFYGTLLDNTRQFYALILCLFVCFPVGMLLGGRTGVRVLNALIAGTLLVLTLASAFGVYAVCTNQYFWPKNAEYGVGIHFWLQRMTVFIHPNTYGLYATIALLLALYRLATGSGAVRKTLCGLCAAVQFAAVALTDSRTSVLASALCIGLFVFRWLSGAFVQTKPALRVFLRVLLSAAAVAAAVAGFRLTVRGVNAVTDWASQSGLPFNGAPSPVETALALPEDEIDLNTDHAKAWQEGAADGTGTIAPATRPFLADGSLTGRTEIWRGALSAVRDNPRILLFGVSPSNVGAVVSPYLSSYYAEMHSSYVQLLVSCGAIALAVFAAFLVLLFLRCLRLFQTPRSRADGFDGGYLAIPLAGIVVIALMETFLPIYFELEFANLWFFLLAGYLFDSDGLATAEGC